MDLGRNGTFALWSTRFLHWLGPPFRMAPPNSSINAGWTIPASRHQLLGGRFRLGLFTGDRPVEYPAFGATFENRAERFRDGLAVIQGATESSFPVFQSKHCGYLDGSIDLVPKPVGPRLPIIAVGRAGQNLDWLAANTDAWIWYLSDFRRVPDVIAPWRAAGDGKTFKPYGYGAFLDLDADPDAPLRFGQGIRTGARGLSAPEQGSCQF